MASFSKSQTLVAFLVIAACGAPPYDPVATAEAPVTASENHAKCLTPPPDKRIAPVFDSVAAASKPGKVPASVKAKLKGSPGKRDGAPPPLLAADSPGAKTKRDAFLAKLAELRGTADPSKFDAEAAVLKEKMLGD